MRSPHSVFGISWLTSSYQPSESKYNCIALKIILQILNALGVQGYSIWRNISPSHTSTHKFLIGSAPTHVLCANSDNIKFLINVPGMLLPIASWRLNIWTRKIGNRKENRNLFETQRCLSPGNWKRLQTLSLPPPMSARGTRVDTLHFIRRTTIWHFATL